MKNDKNKPQRILRLEAQNVKKLKAVEIEPNGNLVIIGGKNGVGKSSVLDSILIAIGARFSKDIEPLRKGTVQGHVICELDDYVIKRKLTKKGLGSLTITSKEDSKIKYSSPQKMLDGITGSLSFDPLAFANMDKKKQLDTLKEIVGLDFTELNEERLKAYEERADANRSIKELRVKLDDIGDIPDDTPDEKISLSDLLEDIKIGEEQNKVILGKCEELDRIDVYIGEARKSIEDHENGIIADKEVLKDKLAEFKEKEILKDSLEIVDISVFEKQIEESASINENVRLRDEKIELHGEIVERDRKISKLTFAISECDLKKEALLADSKMPIEKLSFDETGVIYDGLPFGQVNSAKQLEVSVAMGIAMNPDLKVLLIKNGSLLDEESLENLKKMADDSGHQIWLEKVGNSKVCQIIIQDGMVKE